MESSLVEIVNKLNSDSKVKFIVLFLETCASGQWIPTQKARIM